MLNAFVALYYLLKFYFFDSKKIKRPDVVFFLPVYHTGGAEKVHLNIVKSLETDNKLVIFTENSSTKNFLNEFKKHAEVIEINYVLTKKNEWINNLLTFILIKKLNKSSSIKTIFGSNTNYYYDIIPKIKKSVKKIDLFHAFKLPDHRENNIIKTAAYIDYRVVINSKALEDIHSIYIKYNVEELYQKRIIVIGNGIKLGSGNYVRRNDKILRFGFVGRWSPEKRPYVFLSLAKDIVSKFNNVEFTMVGTGMKSNLEIITKSGALFLGEITTEGEMANFYENLSFVLVPSEREGFPMVIMEAMSHGVIPIATNVGGIAEHLNNDENGILINEVDDDKVFNAFLMEIYELLNDGERREKLSKNAFTYAQANFGIEKFQKSYRDIFS